MEKRGDSGENEAAEKLRDKQGRVERPKEKKD